VNIYKSSSHPTLEATTYIPTYYNTFVFGGSMYKDTALPNVSNFVSSALQLRAFEQQLIIRALEWNSNMQAHLYWRTNDIPPAYRKTLTLPKSNSVYECQILNI